MPEFIVMILIAWFDGPMIIEITAPSCDEAIVDVASTMGPFLTEVLSCIEVIGV